ncbi:GMC family oxidoreductase N-terminal domain-containing protein [Nonomuraea sp. NPDC005692]|uniref:GMC family oxidoreductase n=1 Tax=Nonomuraea sp. NPDC005692 TaxID=3157168 RepID=UPI003411A450
MYDDLRLWRCILTTDPSPAEYVVVGGGSAGSVLVRRLLDAGHSVHLLEAGGPDTGPLTGPLIRDPRGWPLLLLSRHTANLATIPQREAYRRRLRWTRGTVLGGGSAVNAAVYVRGHAHDFDAWAQAGCHGWSWQDVLPLFKRSEDYALGPALHHGSGGPLPVEPITDPNPLSLAFLQAAQEYGHPLTHDFNGENMTGVGCNHLNTRDGRRVSAWNGFAGPLLNHRLLTVTTGVLAHRILFNAGRAVGVQYSQRHQSKPGRIVTGSARTHVARAHTEVIVCAGVIGSPALLLRSGIGPAEHLRALDLPVITDLPGVGQNLHDHLLVPVVYRSARWLPWRTRNFAEAQLFAHSGRHPGPAPDLMPVLMHLVYPPRLLPPPGHGYTIAAGLVRPLSRGTLRLAGADPDVAVRADPQVLTEPADLEVLVQAVRMCRDIGDQAPLRNWRSVEVLPGPSVKDDSDLRAFVRQTVSTYHHQAGTCRMGTDPRAVVAPDLRIHGVDGLRVADASIMPRVPSANINAATIMIGEKAADLVLS